MRKEGRQTRRQGIKQLAEKKWQVRVTTRDPRTGQKKEKVRVMENVDFRTACAEQDAMRAGLESEWSASVIRPESSRCDMTLGDYAVRWLKHASERGSHRPHVLERLVVHLEGQILPLLGHLRLDQLNPQVLDLWSVKLAGMKKANGKPYATETLRSAWQSLRALLNDARMVAGFKVDVDGFEFRARGTPPREKDVLEREEMHAILREARLESPDMCAMIWLGFTTGMRFGELSALTFDDVDFVRGVVTVRHSQVGGHVGVTKTGKTRRVPLLPEVAEQLEALPAWQAQHGIEPVVPGLVFPAHSGLHRASATLAKPLAACARRAGITKHVTPHTMRRTANNLVRQVSGEIAARALVGHSTTAMTEHYSHVSLAEKQGAVRSAVGDLRQAASGGRLPGAGGAFGGVTPPKPAF